MSRQVRITSPLPSVDEIAVRAGVPASRVRELVQLADQLAGPSASRKATAKTATKGAVSGKSNKGTAAKKTVR